MDADAPTRGGRRRRRRRRCRPRGSATSCRGDPAAAGAVDRGAARRASACASADLPFTLGGRDVSGRHRARARAGERRRSRGDARRDCRAPRRRGRADRQRVRRGRHLARQRQRAGAQGAARADGVGHADAEPVRRLGALHARAPLRPAGDHRPHRLARRASISLATTCWCCRRATTPSIAGDGAAPPQGLDQRRRHADHAGRGVALGGARQPSACCRRRRSCGAASRTSRRRRRRPTSRRSDGRPAQPIDIEKAIQPERERPDGARRAAARDARSRALALGRHRRRDPGDGRRLAHLHADQAGQGPQRRRLQQARHARSPAAWCGTTSSRSTRARRS